MLEKVTDSKKKQQQKKHTMSFTHKWKVSLNFGAQLLFLDLVVNLRFLSLRCGPIIVTSTKGRNIPDVCHLRSFAATTEHG